MPWRCHGIASGYLESVACAPAATQIAPLDELRQRRDIKWPLLASPASARLPGFRDGSERGPGDREPLSGSNTERRQRSALTSPLPAPDRTALKIARARIWNADPWNSRSARSLICSKNSRSSSLNWVPKRSSAPEPARTEVSCRPASRAPATARGRRGSRRQDRRRPTASRARGRARTARWARTGSSRRGRCRRPAGTGWCRR